MAKYDVDGGGTLKLDEFIAMVRDLVAAQQGADAVGALDDHKIARTFALLDFDASGEICKRELQEARARRFAGRAPGGWR